MKKKYLYLFLFGALVFRLIFSPFFYHPDVNNHLDWGERFFEYTPSKVYSHSSNVWSYTWPNQPPGTMYLFAAIHKLYLFIFSIVWFVNVKISFFPSTVMPFFEFEFKYLMYKLPAIFSDFGIAYLIYKILFKLKVKQNKALFASLFFLINPAIWYNSTIWGQTDAIISFLFLLGIYFLINKNLFFGVLFVFLSIYVKVSLLIFIPIVVIYIFKNYKFSNIIKNLFVCFLFILLITIPFSKETSNPISYLFFVYTQRVLTQQLHLITANAFNFWAFLTGIDQKPDSLNLLFFNYSIWGYIIFFSFYLILIFKLFRKNEVKNLLWVLGLVAMASFVFLTNMHERYLYPVFPYLGILGFSTNKNVFKIYVLLSLIYLINLYNFWWVPNILIVKNLLLLFDQIVPRILGLVMTITFLYLLKISFSKKYNE